MHFWNFLFCFIWTILPVFMFPTTDYHYFRFFIYEIPVFYPHFSRCALQLFYLLCSKHSDKTWIYVEEHLITSYLQRQNIKCFQGEKWSNFFSRYILIAVLHKNVEMKLSYLSKTSMKSISVCSFSLPNGANQHNHTVILAIKPH